MRKAFAFILLISFYSCNYVTYSPKNKKKQLREKPSVIIFDRIIDFRLEQKGWPVSKTDLMSKGTKYYYIFEDFPYQTTVFKIIDSNKMIFYFSNHINTNTTFQKPNKIDLNAYGGHVKFYKENNKFIWELKMN